ncbi:uncharacterized protein BT62DRAFT_928613 [Guyanagaster necrorhizus]|uniref:TIGR02453 family protein n=1 Tax=Guyanagaster necrorhizus TaxID=856835 RepID=A0A9P7VZZ1_9AGAR|nr:uncharacterized protein BT62DRAFT_928613 [Guyanagaster necrorhizus MCA 3950]KAG7449860.1 hypothetical protein BT62DRAFT_928613 [Guyanagaster necrorhizus MCA 3950]
MAPKTRATRASTSRSSKNRKPPHGSEASDVEAEPQRKSPRKRARKVDNSDEEELNSDVLDDDSDNKPKKRKKDPKKKRKVADDEDEWSELELEEGQEVVGVVIDAPKTGQVRPGQVSQNTLDFLAQLKKPECNDREWFKLHERVYRQAEKEWKDFVEAFTDKLNEVDGEIPPLPPRDVIHRIYRDIRFSNDKTPYKMNFSASFSRSGRKGTFAAYHIFLKPGGGSLLAGGLWCPGRNELATIRTNIKRSSSRLRDIISSPEFVKYFGEPKPGTRENIFGREDELKVAPKGVDKDHPDIDLLKCRSFAVVHYFTDEKVLDPNFAQTLADVAVVVRPLVHCLNDLMSVDHDSDDDA